MNHTKITKPLLFIFLLPVLILIITLYFQTHKEITYFKDTEKLEKMLNFTVKASELIHSLQKERGASHGFIERKNEQFSTLLADFQHQTDLNKQALLLEMHTIEDTVQLLHEEERFELLRHDLESLDLERQRIANTKLIVTDTLEYYNRLIITLITITQKITHFSTSSTLSKNANAYIHLCYAKEYLGRVRAIGTSMLEQKYANVDLKTALIKAHTLHQTYIRDFLSHADEATERNFRTTVSEPFCQQIDQMTSELIHTRQGEGFTIESIDWYEQLTRQIDSFHAVEAYQLNKLQETITLTREELFEKMTWVIALNVIIVAITAFLIFFLLRNLKEIERRLRQKLDIQQNIYEKLFNESGDGVILVSDEEKIINCNDAVVRLFGYENKQEMINLSPADLSPERQPDGQSSRSKIAAIRALTEKEGVTHFEWMHCKKDGQPLYVEVTLTPMQINDETFLHSVVRDISEQKALEKKTREQNAQLIHQSRFAQMGEMLAMIAHQWRQPLTAIASTASLLRTKIILNNYEKELFEEQLKNITDFSQHLSITIDDFRDFFKADKQHTSIALPEVVEDALKIVQISLTNRNIVLNKEYLSNDMIQSYPSELKQVVLNLLTNAKDILSEKGIEKPEISIKVYRHLDHICVDIADNAGGIPESIIEKIFDPYFTTKESLNGTGLGLYMSKKIIEEHCEGTITIQNVNGGACFTISLPLDDQDESV